MKLLDILRNVVNLSISTVEVGVSSVGILSSARDVSSAATTMASAMEELGASISEIENSAQRTSDAAQESGSLTRQGMQEIVILREMVQKTDQAFENVSQRTLEMQNTVASLGKVVDLISRIANQTNLLALNATIEAARAGAAGKGFAVVANEVKSLSRQTREATDTISAQIADLNGVFSQVLDGIRHSKEIVHQVDQKADKVKSDFSCIDENAQSISTRIADLSGIISQQREAISLMASNMAVVKQRGDSNLESVGRLADQSDNAVRLIEQWRSEIANEDIENKVIYLAKADHVLWKKTVLDMALGRSGVKASDLTDHTLCRLGKWYAQQAGTATGRLPAFALIEAPHRQVHEAGLKAARLFEQGKIEDGLNHYRELEDASHKVVDALDQLIRQAGSSPQE